MSGSSSGASAASVPDDLPVVVVETERLRLVFAPSRGGRLLGLAVDGHELLWKNPRLVDEDFLPVRPVADWPAGDGGMSTWANLGGSKTWPAPQGWSGPGEWAGPPDGVLDAGEWAVTVERAFDTVSGAAVSSDTVVTLTSAPDPRSGLRVSRTFTVPHAGLAFAQRVEFTNTSAEPVRWSIWEVCQVDTSGAAGLRVDDAAVVVPVAAASPGESTRAGRRAELDLGTYWGGLESTSSDGEVRLPLGTAVAKRGFPAATGAVSYRTRRDPGLTLSSVVQENAEYPDGGSRVEVWLQTPTPEPIAALEGLHPDADLVELEVLGPLVTLLPGESTSLSIAWAVQEPGDA
ncbi:hypothetical protein ACPEEZ_12585 [Frigoribacterium sp. 2-23]|uniref:hypothetical protein n=1 Tax=Frigoribacterium sp. 2-23 TaxID=3415006 RepID=UPI003C6F1F89